MNRLLTADELLRIRWRLAEAIAWCAGRACDGDQGDSLWTPELRPAALAPRATYREICAGQGRYEGLDLCDRPAADRIALVEELCAARARALAQTGRAPNAPAESLAGGRLLVCHPDETVWDGTSEHATGGFFDVHDVPAWDTWGRYVHADELRSYLVSWVPPELLAVAGEGIRVNPVDCVHWIEDAGELPVARQLRQAFA